jgi:phage baseplate assembly protein W
MTENRFYRLPLNFDSVFEHTDEYMKTCSEKESIDQFIEMLIMTCPGEHKFDKNFGSQIWDMDFVKMISRVNWEKDFTHYLIESVTRYEHRITDINVTATISEVDVEDPIYQSVTVKNKASIIIKCKLLSTGENVAFYYTLYLGPISNE